MNIIEIKHLKKSFKDVKAVNDISFKVKTGELFAFLGVNGAGKSTLVRCINMLEKADEGQLVFDGVTYNLGHMHRKDIAKIRKKTAFVFQNYNLFANKTALQNVTLGLTSARGMKKDEAEKIGREMLDKVGLLDKQNNYPGQLSGGQQQRVAIARALATKPEIIYFDEPTSALDPELIGEVLTVMRQLAAEGMTMLVVTHEMNFARNVSNKVVFMDDGKVLETAESREFFENPKEDRVKEFLKNITSQHDA